MERRVRGKGRKTYEEILPLDVYFKSGNEFSCHRGEATYCRFACDGRCTAPQDGYEWCLSVDIRRGCIPY